MMPSLPALAAYSAQLAILVAVSAAAVALLRVRAPIATLRFWYIVALAALLLPLAPAPSETSSPLTTSRADAFVSQVATLGNGARDTSIAALIVAVIAGGIVARIAWLAVGLWRLRRVLVTAEPHPTIARVLDTARIAHREPLDIRISDDVDGPATIGVVHPVILLPRRILDLPVPIQRAAIVHELMHVRRRDWIATIAEEMCCAVMWFHPAVRVLASRLALARETVVDQRTLAATGDRRAYAQALLAFAEPAPRTIGMTPMIMHGHLLQRIALIAKEDTMSGRRTLIALLAALSLAGSATVLAAVTLPIAAQSRDTTVYEPGNGVTLPVMVKEVRADYTPEAMQQGIQGAIFMAVVVQQDGTVGEVQVTQSLDKEYGLDDEAVAAARQWEFKPGTKDGKPVNVRVTIEMRFTLK